MLVQAVSQETGIDIAALASARPASRSAQLALLGALIMADWVASNDHHFPGVPLITDVGFSAARDRAATGWAALGLRGGWTPQSLPRYADPVAARFGLPGRPAQQMVVELAERVPAPCLLMIEAPMGEGKTEAALVAVEILARRFGADGVFVGMPTQATSDPMFGRVRRWAQQVDDAVPMALLHGKARFNRDWQQLRHSEVQITGVDELGCDDRYGLVPGQVGATSSQAPAEWFLGNKRGLLTPIVVGTVDQLLHAATRTRHVMLRHAGLAGKIVMLDEVHAYDVYMTQFLHEALRWLAEAGVPVVVLSATLPPATRVELARAYLQGATGERDIALEAMPAPAGYPSAIAVTAQHRDAVFLAGTSPTWRSSCDVVVEELPEPVDDSPAAVVELLGDRLRDGGCALVIRNTVGRAQQTYLAAKELYGPQVVLLHARLTAGERADRTEQVLDWLGPAAQGRKRPDRLVVVATQLAEQSFDVDADLVVSDLAPIDLLLQRVGRLHRHDRPSENRPERLRHPRVVVTGMRGAGQEVPRFPRGSRFVYGEHLLLRAALLVQEAAGQTRGWSIPADVPALVRRGYDDSLALPEPWQEAAASAAEQRRQDQDTRRARAEQFLLSGPHDLGAQTLKGLHHRAITDLDDNDHVAAVVRDGDPSIEVILVRHDERGYQTLDGRTLGPTGAAVSDPDILERVVRDCVRLRPDLTDAAIAQLAPLPGWSHDAWLSRARALILDSDSSTVLGGWRLTYDQDLGLMASRQA